MTTDRYLDEFPGDQEGDPVGGDPVPAGASPEETKESRLMLFWEGLSRAGLGETVFRVGTGLLSVALVLVAIWAMRSFYLHAQAKPALKEEAVALVASLPSATPTVVPMELPPLVESAPMFAAGIPRLASLHTNIPTRPRTEIITYTVETGDTIFGIAEKFNLRPQTVLWGNYYTLLDNPHYLHPGQVLTILPSDGTYHKWSAGEGLNGVAAGYDVKPEAIIDWPGNHLNVETLGDWSQPNIEAGTFLFVPGGEREFVSWSSPPWLTRKNPAVAKVLGPGACGSIMEGAIGTGSFVWPTYWHRLSGYDWSPATNHFGIDIAGLEGQPLYAADGGVIVYAGWNDHGYGQVVVIDHGTGWQTLYAHMFVVGVECGQSVEQGEVIGQLGTTGASSGPHLHFEMTYNATRVNPWDFLPPP